MRSNKFWLIILGGVVVISAVLALFFWQVPASYARIYKEGVLLTDAVDLLAVTEPYTFVIDGGIDARDWSIGVLNVIEIERGRIRMSEADCAFNICVHRGWVSGGMIPIVCIPNQVVITFEDGRAETDIDAVVG